MVAPVLEEIAVENREKLTVEKLDVVYAKCVIREGSTLISGRMGCAPECPIHQMNDPRIERVAFAL
jgi:hypothetical protein